MIRGCRRFVVCAGVGIPRIDAGIFRYVGITKVDGVTDVAVLEYCIREDLNKRAQRVMGVIDPLKVVITNYPRRFGGGA